MWILLLLALLLPGAVFAADNPLLRQSDGTDVRQGGVADRAKVTSSIDTLLAGEDQLNSVFRVESQWEYETVAASQTNQVLGGSGAAGDLLHALVCVVSTAATAATSILDGATSIAVFPNSPGGGIGTYTIPLDIVATVGPWKVTTGAGVACIAIGRFS